jgi:hypothetical protein
VLITALTVQRVITSILESAIHAMGCSQGVVNVPRQAVLCARKAFTLMVTNAPSVPILLAVKRIGVLRQMVVRNAKRGFIKQARLAVIAQKVC